MSETTSTPAAPVAAKKAPKAKKPVAKKPAKATNESAGRPRKEGLRKPQIRILQALKKAGKPLDRKTIAAKAPVDVATCVEYIGSHDDSIRAANDKKHFPSLLTLGFVKFGPSAEEGGVAYEISAKGKQALEKLSD